MGGALSNLEPEIERFDPALPPIGSRGSFIVFEGLDGAGSTTQCRMFSELLRAARQPVLETAEPSSGPLGAIIRQALQNRLWLAEETVALAFAADRLDHLMHPEHGIVHHLEGGKWVVSDRYVMSSFVYQTAAGLELEWIESINKHAIEPDITVFIDSSVEDCMGRITGRQSPSERYEQRDGLANALGVYRRRLSQLADDRVAIVSGVGSPTDVHRRVVTSPAVAKVLSERGMS